MQLYGTSKLESFAQEYEDSRVPLGAWQLEAEEAQWTDPAEVQARFADAIVQPDRVVFCIKSLYKIDVKARFKQGILLIENVWTTTVSKQTRASARNAALRSKA